MGKYVAVGVLAMIVLAAITYEPPQKSLKQEAKAGTFQGSYGAGQTAPPPADPLPPPLPPGNGTTSEQVSPAPPATPSVDEGTSSSSAGGTYTVKKGQTLRDIAQEVLGDRARWKELYEENRDRLPDPDTLREGMSLAYKVVQAAAETARAGVTTERAPASPSAPTPAAPAPVAAASRTYRVSKGDTLYSIARRELGSGSRWQEIVSINGLPSENVRAGTVLRLPQ